MTLLVIMFYVKLNVTAIESLYTYFFSVIIQVELFWSLAGAAAAISLHGRCSLILKH